MKHKFLKELHELQETFSKDLIKASDDPAFKSKLQTAVAHPGLHAVWSHRIYHMLWEAGLQLPALMMANGTRAYTGVDIHPGATIGQGVVIDHGVAVVIGERAVVEDDVSIFHGVTLGSRRAGDSGEDRHPRIKRGAVLGAGSSILGPVTVGENSKVGANSVVLRDIPAGRTAVGTPARIV